MRYDVAHLDVVARDISSMDLMAGTVGGGAVGIGASVVVNDITSTVRAYLSESETNASRQTRVLADSRESIDAGAATAGVGVVGVSGSVIVSSIATQTRAFTTALKSQLLVNQDAAFGGVLQDVVIRANDTAVIDDDAGALAVLAHPGLVPAWREAIAADARALLAGTDLDGVEAYHPDHDEETRSRLVGLAYRLDLLALGGSDSHGPHRALGLAVGRPSPGLGAEMDRRRDVWT